MRQRGVLLCLLLALSAFLLTPPALSRAQPHVSRHVSMTPGTSRTVLADPYVPHIPPRALAYQRVRRAIGLSGMCWNLLGMALFVRLGYAVRLRDGVYRLLRRPLPEPDAAPPLHATALYYAAYALALLLWNLPFGFGGLAVEHLYGFSRQSVGGYLWDLLIGLGFDCLAALPLSGCIVGRALYEGRVNLKEILAICAEMKNK